MKQKLWIAYWMLGATSLLILATGNFNLSLAFACIAAAFGWTAFLRNEP